MEGKSGELNYGNPLIYSFKTKAGNHYVYSVATNYVYPANPLDIFLLGNYTQIDNEKFKSLIEAEYKDYDFDSSVKRVSSWVKDTMIFNKSFDIMEFPNKSQFEDEAINLRQLILEVTEKCNLKCKYCYQNKLDKNRKGAWHLKDMSWEIAKDSVDYFIKKISHPKRTTSKGSCYLSFYGGEPLLNIGLIEKCIEYIRSLDLDDIITYYVTTNATIIDDRIADFLEKNNIYLLVSLDGPKYENDRNRIFKNGNGSYDKIVKNLEFIKNNYPDYFRQNISFNSVYNARSDLKAIIAFYAKLRASFMPDLKVRFSFDSVSEIQSENSKTRPRECIADIKNKYVVILKEIYKH